MKVEFSSKVRLFFCISLLFFSVLIYALGLPGFYVLDDFYVVIKSAPLNSDREFSVDGAIFSMIASGGNLDFSLHRQLSKLSFYLNGIFFGFNIISYKIFNIALHLFNSILVFFFTKKLFLFLLKKNSCASNYSYNKIFVASFLSSLFYIIHPFFVTTVLYLTQRMAIFSSALVLISLLFFLCFIEKRSIIFLFCFCFFSCAGLYFKENSIVSFLLVIYMYALVEGDSKFKILYMLSLFLFFVLCLIFFHGSISYFIFSSYGEADFTLLERLQSQVVAVKDYFVHYIFTFPFSYKFYNDDFEIVPIFSFEWIFSFLLLTSLFLMSVLAIFSKDALLKSVGFGCAFFLIACLPESSVFGIELYYEHRAYLPSVGTGIIICSVFLRLNDLLERKSAFYTIICVYILFSLFVTFIRVMEWRDPVVFARSEFDKSPHSYRAALRSANYNLECFGNIESQKCGLAKRHTFESLLYHYEKENDARQYFALAQLLLNSMRYFPERYELDLQNFLDYAGKNKIYFGGYAIFHRLIFACSVNSFCQVKVSDDLVLKLVEKFESNAYARGGISYVYSVAVHYFLDKGRFDYARYYALKAFEMSREDIHVKRNLIISCLLAEDIHCVNKYNDAFLSSSRTKYEMRVFDLEHLQRESLKFLQHSEN